MRNIYQLGQRLGFELRFEFGLSFVFVLNKDLSWGYIWVESNKEVDKNFGAAASFI